MLHEGLLYPVFWQGNFDDPEARKPIKQVNVGFGAEVALRSSEKSKSDREDQELKFRSEARDILIALCKNWSTSLLYPNRSP